MNSKRHITINVMSALLVGDPMNPSSEASQEARKKFRRQLKKMKRLRVDAVSVDFWWGLLQPEAGPIDWTKPGPAYYDWVVNEMIAQGLKVIPILSFHQCGGNVGDDVFVPSPAHIWTKLAGILGDARHAKFVSEQGNASDEFVSFWATHLVLDDYLAVVKQFRDHFADRAQHIAEINISLGPAGELRYPSYNTHDKGVDYPKRGALQCYSKLAIESWRSFVLARYGDEKGVDAAWGTKIAQGQQILPPSNAAQFFADKHHVNLQYGRDFFDWYAEQPLIHARMVLKGVFEILAADDSPMKGIDIGVKVPGIHWLTGSWVFDAKVTGEVLQKELSTVIASFAKDNAGKLDATAYGARLAQKLAEYVRERTQKWVPEVDGGVIKLGSRLAELAAGLIRTSDSADWEKDEAGRGYRPLIKLFAEFEGNANSRLVLHFTCLEMADGENSAAGAQSVAKSLVQWVGAEATRQGVPIKGENAVWWNLPTPLAWELMRQHLVTKTEPAANRTSPLVPCYEGLTILRMSHVAEYPVATTEMAKTIAYVNGEPMPTAEALAELLKDLDEGAKDSGASPADKTVTQAASANPGPAPVSTTGDTGTQQGAPVQATPAGEKVA